MKRTFLLTAALLAACSPSDANRRAPRSKSFRRRGLGPENCPSRPGVRVHPAWTSPPHPASHSIIATPFACPATASPQVQDAHAQACEKARPRPLPHHRHALPPGQSEGRRGDARAAPRSEARAPIRQGCDRRWSTRPTACSSIRRSPAKMSGAHCRGGTFRSRIARGAGPGRGRTCAPGSDGPRQRCSEAASNT